MTGALEPDVDAGLPEDVFREVDRSLRSLPYPDCVGRPEEIHQHREVFPESVHEAAVSPAGTATADVGLQQHDIRTGIGLLQVERGPQARVSPTDDCNIGSYPTLQGRARRPGVRGKGFAEPPRSGSVRSAFGPPQPSAIDCHCLSI